MLQFYCYINVTIFQEYYKRKFIFCQLQCKMRNIIKKERYISYFRYQKFDKDVIAVVDGY